MQPETQLPSSNASLPSERMDGRGAFPVSTYRVQFRPEFTLRDAAEIVPYLRTLGISHLYASPILQAVPGTSASDGPSTGGDAWRCDGPAGECIAPTVAYDGPSTGGDAWRYDRACRGMHRPYGCPARGPWGGALPARSRRA